MLKENKSYIFTTSFKDGFESNVFHLTILYDSASSLAFFDTFLKYLLNRQGNTVKHFILKTAFIVLSTKWIYKLFRSI